MTETADALITSEELFISYIYFICVYTSSFPPSAIKIVRDADDIINTFVTFVRTLKGFSFLLDL